MNLLFACLFVSTIVSSSILSFWGVRSWRNFLLLLITLREFEDSDFLLRVQIVLFHFMLDGWIMCFGSECLSFGDIKPGQLINSLPVEISYLIEKQFLSQSATLFLMNTHKSEYAFLLYSRFLYLLAHFLIRFEFIVFYTLLFHVKLMFIWW